MLITSLVCGRSPVTPAGYHYDPRSISCLSFSQVLVSPRVSCSVPANLIGHLGRGGSSFAMIFAVSASRNRAWFPAHWQIPLGLGQCGQAHPGKHSGDLSGGRAMGSRGPTFQELGFPAQCCSPVQAVMLTWHFNLPGEPMHNAPCLGFLLTTGKNQKLCLATASPAPRILAFYSGPLKLFFQARDAHLWFQ